MSKWQQNEMVLGGAISKLTRQRLLAAHHNKQGFRGIYWDSTKNRFRAEIGHRSLHNPRKRLGYFHTAKDAAEAYDIAAIERYGEDAALNFPMPGERKTKFGGSCVHGKENIYVSPRGDCNCRICNLEAVNRYKIRMLNAGYKRKKYGPWFKEEAAE